MFKIDFTDTYEIADIAEDFSAMTFYSPDTNGKEHLLKVEINPHPDTLLPNVFNLAFGPIVPGTNDINDAAKINHDDINKMFSTVLLLGLLFLQANPEMAVGIDGSDDVRAYLYHRMFMSNKENLEEFFETFGVDWFVRLKRNGSIEVDNEGLPIFKPIPRTFDYMRPANDLYHYYIFKLRS